MVWADLKPLRPLVKHGLAATALHLGALGGLRRARRALLGPAVHLFGWHVIVDESRPIDAAGSIMPALCVSRRSLALQIDHLRRHYHVWPLADAAEAVAGRRRLPRDRDVAVVTFDDGYRSVLDLAAPLLAARGVPATVFVTTSVAETGAPLLHDRLHALLRRMARAHRRVVGLRVPGLAPWPLAACDAALAANDTLGATEAILAAAPRTVAEVFADVLAEQVGEPGDDEVPATLRWDEIAALTRLGFTIGAHTVSHAHLPLEGDDSLRLELEAPRRRLAQALGGEFDALAYPSGRYDRRVVMAARRAGYRIGVTTEDRPSRPGDSPLRLGRKVITEGHARAADGEISPAMVAAQLDGLFRALGASRLERGDVPSEAAWIP